MEEEAKQKASPPEQPPPPKEPAQERLNAKTEKQSDNIFDDMDEIPSDLDVDPMGADPEDFKKYVDEMRDLNTKATAEDRLKLFKEEQDFKETFKEMFDDNFKMPTSDGEASDYDKEEWDPIIQRFKQRTVADWKEEIR